MSATRMIALGLMAVGLTVSLLPNESEARCRRARRSCCSYSYSNCCYNPCATTCCGATVSTACGTGCGNGCAPSTTVHYGQYQESQGQTTIQSQPAMQAQPGSSGSPSNQTFQGAPPAPAPRTDENRDRGPDPVQAPPTGAPAESRPST